MIHYLKTNLEKIGNPEYAQKQMAYMKNHFEFYGANAAAVRMVFKKAVNQFGIYKEPEALIKFVKECWEAEHREMQYIAHLMMQKTMRYQPNSVIKLLEHCITTKSWWDTVDVLSRLVKDYFVKYPASVEPITEKWMASSNIWLQRTCIIFQRFKNYPTDWEMLCQYILQVAGSKEFFLQKACGWALREHAKTHPNQVIEFLDQNSNQLSALTKREASKYL